MNNPKRIRMTVLATAIAAACALANAQDVTLYESHVLPEALVFEPNSTIGMNSDIDIAVKGPNGLVLQQSFAAGEPMELNPATIIEGGLPDGTYRYEMKVMAIKGVVAQRNGKVGDVPEIAQPGFGTFTIRNGKLVSPDDEEPLYKGADAGASVHAAVQGTADTGKEETRQVIAQDLIVQGSLCVGFDCVNGESFGFDTLRLKENNTRIKFDDTSTSGSFPNNDWQLTANDSNNGGLNRFSIENTTVGRVPFTIEGPAPSNSLYVDDGGRVGFGTSTPVVQNHIVDGNTPTVRLEQDGSSGFTAQTWDIAGNEANFFIRDVTNGSSLPFRIRPGAPESSIDIAANGNVGMGTTSPGASLHVQRDSDAKIRIENTSGTATERSMFQLVNSGKTRFEITNQAANSTWTFDNTGPRFQISRAGTGVAEFQVTETGNGIFQGTVTANGVLLSSSRTVKNNIRDVDSSVLLDKVMRLPIRSWRYTSDDSKRNHIGPIAEEFHALFKMGDSRHVDLIDTTGITLAALQASTTEYRQRITSLDEELRAQRERVAELEAKLERLENALN